MKERSKERYAALLMEELLERLAERENIKRMLGEMIALPVEELISLLLNDFEKIVEQRCSVAASKKKEAVLELMKSPPITAPTAPKPHQGQTPEAPPSQPATPLPAAGKPLTSGTTPASPRDETRRTSSPDQRDTPAADVPLHADKPEQEPSEPPLELDALLQRINAQLDEKLEEQETRGRTDHGTTGSDAPVRTEEDDEDADDEGDEREEVLPTTRLKPRAPRIPYRYDEHDHVYFHAVARVSEPGEVASEPFMLEEKGIDQRNFAFALDVDNLRFYLSKFQPAHLSVAKNGVLLLSKQEGLQLRGVHQNILNDLRVHSTLLPFEFGTIARSRVELMQLIQKNINGLQDALESVHQTKWWTVNLYVLDSRIAQIFSDNTPAPAGRSRERERPSHIKQVPASRFDIKMLERILQKEKKIAESVHKALESIADRSDIDVIVGLTSGSSEEWKLILKASYEVPERRMQRFHRAVIDLQYDHMLFDLMLSVEGNREFFSMKRA
jgi:Gas vesicle synthesis protein GvpL/GvpF